ncbi:hypothetical protein AB0B30_08705 [Streptomyces narbonensis]|uniref:hypothetical protein n=1 Tax=Streptomyces narbonensis TaxID=67333 RepID=UPI0033D84FAF
MLFPEAGYALIAGTEAFMRAAVPEGIDEARARFGRYARAMKKRRPYLLGIAAAYPPVHEAWSRPGDVTPGTATAHQTQRGAELRMTAPGTAPTPCGGIPRRLLDAPSPAELERYLLTSATEAWSQPDWVQLRVLAVGRMQSPALTRETRLRWGHLALCAISETARSQTPQQTTADSTRVRAYLILEFGMSDSDAARDLPALCSEILGNLGVPLEAAERLAEDWRSAPGEQMLRLRRIKNMLTPLLPLQALLKKGGPAFQETRDWMKLIPDLP